MLDNTRDFRCISGSNKIAVFSIRGKPSFTTSSLVTSLERHLRDRFSSLFELGVSFVMVDDERGRYARMRDTVNSYMARMC